jgi:hypothetical protein
MRGRRDAAAVLLATIGLAALCAIPAAARRPAKPRGRTMELRILYTGHESIEYDGWLSEAPSGPPTCVRTIHGDSRYSFSQEWHVKVRLRPAGHGHLKVKVLAIEHIRGPASPGLTGHSDQSGHMTSCTYDLGQKPDDGSFDCTATSLQYRSPPSPEMVVERSGAALVLQMRTFLLDKGNFSGRDTIPTDGGCSFFDFEGGTYGADLFPGPSSSALWGMTADRLDHLNEHNFIHEDVNWHQRAVAPEPPDPDCTVGENHHNASCTLNTGRSDLDGTVLIDQIG